PLRSAEQIAGSKRLRAKHEERLRDLQEGRDLPSSARLPESFGLELPSTARQKLLVRWITVFHERQDDGTYGKQDGTYTLEDLANWFFAELPAVVRQGQTRDDLIDELLSAMARQTRIGHEGRPVEIYCGTLDELYERIEQRGDQFYRAPTV